MLLTSLAAAPPRPAVAPPPGARRPRAGAVAERRRTHGTPRSDRQAVDLRLPGLPWRALGGARLAAAALPLPHRPRVHGPHPAGFAGTGQRRRALERPAQPAGAAVAAAVHGRARTGRRRRVPAAGGWRRRRSDCRGRSRSCAAWSRRAPIRSSDATRSAAQARVEAPRTGGVASPRFASPSRSGADARAGLHNSAALCAAFGAAFPVAPTQEM